MAVGPFRRNLLARIERGPRAPRPGPAVTPADLGFLAALFVGARGVMLAVAALAGATADPGNDLAGALIRWDARWYVEIAAIGYHPAPAGWESGDGTNWPFFPALPLLIAALRLVTGLSPEGAAVAVGLACSAAGLLAFFLYARELYGRRFARRASLVFALWPFAIHQTAPMSEAVFAPLALVTLWLARRGAFLGAGVAAALLSSTRPAGAFVAFPLLLIALRRHGLPRLATVAPGVEPALAMLAACGVGAGAYALYLHALTGDALAFTHAQVAWGREPAWPWMTMIDGLNPLVWGWRGVAFGAFNLAVAGVALALAIALLRLRLGAEALYVALVVLLGLTAGSTMSLPRFVGAMAPLAIPVAWALRRRPRLRAPVLGALGAAMLAAAWGWARQSLYVM